MTWYETLVSPLPVSVFTRKMGVSVDCWVIAGLAESLVLYSTKFTWPINGCGYHYFSGSPKDPAPQELAFQTCSPVTLVPFHPWSPSMCPSPSPQSSSASCFIPATLAHRCVQSSYSQILCLRGFHPRCSLNLQINGCLFLVVLA